MQRAKRLAVMLAVVLIALAGVLQVWAQGNVIHVSATVGTDGPGCGAGAAPPCRSIKFAVENRAQTGDRILVAAGTYTEPFSVLTSGVQILATGPAGINGQDTRGPMIAAGAGITAATVISGFTITGGVTTTTAAAGGVYLTGDASPVLHGNTICANGGFQLARGGAGVVDAAGNWWGTNTPRAGVTYTGTVQAAPPISVSLQLRQPLTGTGSLGSLGSGSLVVGRVAQITVTMKGGGYTPPPGTAITLKGTHGAFSGGVTATSLLIANGVATTLFTPTASRATVISAFHACNPSQAVATLDFRFHVYLPLTLRGYPAPPPPPPPEPEPTCPITSTAQFGLLSTNGRADHPDYLHGDLNLSLRGYDPFTDSLDLVTYPGGTAADPPKLSALVASPQFPFAAVYRVYGWIWDPAQCGGNPDGCRGPLLTYNPTQLRWWDVTLVGLKTTPGEPVYLPARNAQIDPGGQKALVLYAEEKRITLGYTIDDTVANGYTVHIENVCVDPNLLALYRAQINPDGTRKTGKLPALSNGQALGTALTDEMQFAIRDRGTFMDPRSSKDWW